MSKQMSEVETLVCMHLAEMVETVEYNILCRGGKSILESIGSSLVLAKECVEWNQLSVADLTFLDGTIRSYETFQRLV